MVHLFVVYGHQGAEEDADKLHLADKLLQAVLAEVVCVGQPMLIAGDLNADPAVIPCLALGMSAGRLTWLLRIPLVLVFCLTVLVLLIRVMVLVLVGIFELAVPMLSLLPRRAVLRTGGLLLTFLQSLCFVLLPGWLMSLALLLVNLLWPACWLDTPDRSYSWGCPEQVFHGLRDAASGSSVDDFWSIWSKSAEAGLLHANTLVGGPVAAGSSAFLGGGALTYSS